MAQRVCPSVVIFIAVFAAGFDVTAQTVRRFRRRNFVPQ
jgi:hypothetical protein